MLLDIPTTQIPNTWMYGTITGLLALMAALIVYIYIDFKTYIKSKLDHLDLSVNSLHRDLEPIKIELGVHKEKIEKIDKKVETVYERQIHDNRDIQALQIRTNQLVAKTG